jgi:hypothetical protein
MAPESRARQDCRYTVLHSSGGRPLSRGRQLLLASVASCVVTFGLFGAAYRLALGPHRELAHILYWQGYCLQSLVPAANLGTPEHPIYEANPMHVVAAYAGIPLGLVLYFVLALAILRLVSRRRGGPT